LVLSFRGCSVVIPYRFCLRLGAVIIAASSSHVSISCYKIDVSSLS
jgi:hypothetical protein